MESLEEMHRCCAVPGIAYGRRLKDVLPPDTVIATTMAGGIAYYSGLTTIDQLGLTDREVARHGVLAKPVRRGHTKRASTSYLASRGVNLVIHHPKVFSCRQPRTKGPGAYVFIRMQGDRLPSHAVPHPDARARPSLLLPARCLRRQGLRLPGKAAGPRARPTLR